MSKPKVMTVDGWRPRNAPNIYITNSDRFADMHQFTKHGHVPRQPSRIEKPSVLALRVAQELNATELIYITSPSCIWVWYKK